MRHLLLSALFLMPIIFPQGAKALSLVPPDGQHFSDGVNIASVALASVDLEYDMPHSDPDSSKKVLGVGLLHGFGGNLAVFGQVGAVLDSELDNGNYDFDGGGYVIGGGVQGRFTLGPATAVCPYAMLNYWAEELEEKIGAVTLDADLSITDLHLGAVVTHRISPAFIPYAGAEFIFMSDGDYEIKGSTILVSATDDGRFERDDTLNLRLGALYQLPSVTLRVELIAAGESSLVFGGSMRL